jgi:hypothetical protein
MSVYSQLQNKIWVLGGFDGWECLNSVEMIDLDGNSVVEQKPLASRVKNGQAILNEAD